MDASDFVLATYLKATGTLYTGTFGDDDSLKILQLANLEIDAWAKEDDWASLYNPGVSIGTVSATDTFDLDDSIRDVSNQPDDYIQIVRLDGNITNYETVEAKRLKRFPHGNYCAVVGTSLKFNKAFTSSDPEFGGTINVPGYLYANHLAKANDDIPVDNPNWLVVITSADWVQSDVTLAQNRPDLIAQAQDLMTSMQKANKAQVETIDKTPFLHTTTW